VPGHVDFLEGSNLYEANLLLPEEGAEMPHMTPIFPAERTVDNQHVKCI
jgi:hypothetical protein